MLVRVFEFRVKKGSERRVEAFMRRKPMALLRSIPSCRQAYFLRSREKKGVFLWVTVWTSPGALRRAMAGKAWKALVKEETVSIFAGKPKAGHWELVARK